MKPTSRRTFLKHGVVAATALSGLTSAMPVHAADNNVLKVGLVGCGSRGLGAVKDAFSIDSNIHLTAVGDAFADKAAAAVAALKKDEQVGSRIAVTPETTFGGLDAYKNVIDNCDVVFLCQTPHFRPMSLRYAVEKGRHIFCEKPVAVDGAGVKDVLESAKIAREKKLQLVSGLCYRYDPNILDMIKRIQDGAIGDVLSVRANFLTGAVWTRSRQPGDTEMMYQIRNWYNFTWLSGDFNVEQAVHSLDKSMWALGDKTPAFAYGLGGRMRRTGEHAAGDIYDSMGVAYEYPNGRTLISFCSQLSTCFAEREEYVLGTKGTAALMKGQITGENKFVQKKVSGNRFQLEHDTLFKAIRSGGAVQHNDGEFMANSTMITILGRLACYTGKRLSWDEALNMETPTRPTGYTKDSNPPTLPDENGRYKVEIPGLGLVYHQTVR
ncbi:MAG: Gfo/Idh/MocA family oxidoreductase [Planctomycetaceae bacterium]|jgi:predicted dehydrogenase|nr:Gfo/Idh/MocA family oxidoreductase [Planctomycetaceae bacterium]